MANSVLDTLTKVREILAPANAWTQKMYRDPISGCVCLGGAIAQAVRPDYWPQNTPLAIASDEGKAAVKALSFPDYTIMIEWNDHDERTHAQVLERIDAAITELQR